MASFLSTPTQDENNLHHFNHYLTPSTPPHHPVKPDLDLDDDDNQNLYEENLEEYPRVTTPTTDTKPNGEHLNSGERRQHEIEESERLAWQLMEEESMHAYELQMEYMRNNPELFSPDEMNAFNEVLNPTEEEPDLEENQVDNDSGTWTYDQLLEIGRVVGDVKTERWRMRSQAVINSLPIETHENVIKNLTERSAETKCSICMEEFLGSDELIVLPCHHYFHSLCSKTWLESNNSCPMCKNKVTSSP